MTQPAVDQPAVSQPTMSQPASTTSRPRAQTDGPTDGSGRLDRLRARREQRRRERVAAGKRGPARSTVLLLGSLSLLVVLFVIALGALFSGPGGRTVSLDRVDLLAASGRVETATLLDQDDQLVLTVRSVKDAVTRGTTGAKPVSPSIKGVPDTAATVRTSVPSNGTLTLALRSELETGGATYRVDAQSGKARLRLFTEFLLPVLFLANIFALLFLSKSGDSAIGDVTSFGQVEDGGRTGASTVTFADVGGAEEAVVELAEVRDYLKDPARYRELGAAPPKGVLLFGPPGTGKTLLAKAVAGEAGVPFFSVAGAEFVESLVGVGAARIRDLFRRVNAVAPAIVFIDELDAAGRKRGSGGGGGGSEEREQTLNQLLVEMDGFDVSTGVVVIAATNRPDILDPALMRPGRFDRHITVERPDAEGRERILRIHAAKKPLAPDVDLARLAGRCPGFTGADLALVVNEAALLTIRRKGRVIAMKELEEAVVRVLEGPQRRGRVLTDDERRRAAHHEIGHVVVAAALGRHEDIHRVSVLSRGRTVAATTFGDSEATLLTKSALHDQLVATLGGIAAEELVLGEGSTGGEQDLEHATDLARDMVTKYGMSEAVGPVRLQVKAGEGFLGDDSSLVDLSPETQRLVETAVRDLVEGARARARIVLEAHRGELDALALRLEEHETLEGEVLEEALAPLVAALERPRATVRRQPAARAAAQPRTSTRPAGKAAAPRTPAGTAPQGRTSSSSGSKKSTRST